jgi:hypothetical protein
VQDLAQLNKRAAFNLLQDLLYDDALLYFKNGQLDPRVLIQMLPFDEYTELVFRLTASIDKTWSNAFIDIATMGT